MSDRCDNCHFELKDEHMEENLPYSTCPNCGEYIGQSKNNNSIGVRADADTGCPYAKVK